MNTSLTGNKTEAAVLNALVERDFAVLVPFGEGHSYDLVIHGEGNTFIRVQCKTARLEKGCVVFNSRSTDHGHGQGTYVGLADIFGVYCPSTDVVYLVPVQEVPRSVVYLRTEPARNNQQRRVRLASDYEIDQWSTVELFRAVVLRPTQGSGSTPELLLECSGF